MGTAPGHQEGGDASPGAPEGMEKGHCPDEGKLIFDSSEFLLTGDWVQQTESALNEKRVSHLICKFKFLF